MLRSSFLNTSAIAFAAPAEAAANPKADKAIEKVVYMSADDSLKSVVLNAGHAAGATLRFVASMVVHLCVRTYHHVDAERRDIKDTSEEILSALKAYAETKRGQPFKNAWCAKLLATSKLMARSMVTDYDKKGVQPGSPLSDVLRSKTPDKAIEGVYTLIVGKTKGANDFAALERALSPKGPSRKQPATGKGSNAVIASTDKPARIAKAMMGDKGHELLNAIPGNAKAKAIKVADKVGLSNVDHLAFVLRSLTFLTNVEDLMAVVETATNLAKDMQAKANKGTAKAKSDDIAAAG